MEDTNVSPDRSVSADETDVRLWEDSVVQLSFIGEGVLFSLLFAE